MGAWIGPVSTQAGLDANAAEIRCLCDHIAQGDVDLAVVGSEALLRGDVTETQLLGYLQQVRTCATQASKNTQVTSADTYGALLSHPNVLAAVDLVFANYYPYWEGRDVQQAVAYIHRWHQQLQAAAPGKEVVVSETGWPTCGASVGDAVPSPSNAALFFLNFVSWARALNVKYFYFEAYDEAWKVHTEGTQGACWGLWDAQGQLKQGMQPVFDCSTIPDNWTNPPSTTPIFAFPSLPEHITTNLPSFLVASTAATADTVAINGVVIPANAFDASGNFATIVPLDLGDNTIELVVTAGSTTVSSTHKTVTYDPSYSTSGRRLVYVDVVSPAASGMPQIDGTIVVDLDASTPLGVVTNRHAVGIAPNGGEIYMADRSVLETATHQIVRQLAFANTIVSNGFLVSPDGTRLYSSNERLDVATNTLLAPLPASIVTGNSWAGNPIPGGPAISPDGRKIYYGNTLGVIDTVDNLATSWNIAPIYLSDLAVSPDGNTLLMSRYAYTTGSVVLYKISDHTQLAALGGLGDFSGEIAPIPGTSFFVAGSAGNPASPTDGKLVTFQADSTAPVSSLTLPLGDNLVASKRGEVIASSGENALFRRAGLDVYLVDASGHLSRDKTIFLGINAFVASSPIPKNDQIRRILLKEFDGAR
jgi:DNA-binding beta-propeller fold protein YncE